MAAPSARVNTSPNECVRRQELLDLWLSQWALWEIARVFMVCKLRKPRIWFALALTLASTAALALCSCLLQLQSFCLEITVESLRK
jgi:hypothetical protein